MILHNITSFTIENGDTLEDPQILDTTGRPQKFDRVLANPPFSQNYDRANVKFPNRFREWCPETGKKADLMFVQHMLASLKTDGHMATVMPHGVLFRGGKEKLIRELLIEDDVIEAIISLPPGLFYGTGIPACVIICNKQKPEALRNKVLFINADREFAEGKNQNKLRPEDIEKIDYVFTHKREIPKYSRLVDKSEIVETHEFNLNIRRYVDNTPAPEPEDVQAHLIGGIPEPEVNNEAVTARNAAFGLSLDHLLQAERPGYLKFVAAIDSKPAIKATIESDVAVQTTLRDHQDALKDWWETAQIDFAQLRTGKTMPEVRQELLTTLKEKLIPLSVLDEFKSAGVFVNWWQQIRFDLKTIMATGWHHTLIPDDYLIAAFFQVEADAIEALEATASEKQSELAEAVEAGQELCNYEPDEGETVTTATVKKALKDQIDDLKDSESKSAKAELAALKAQDKAIKDLEKAIKEAKAAGKRLTDELTHKLLLKRIGDTNFKIETQALLEVVKGELRSVKTDASFQTSSLKLQNSRLKPLQKDIATLRERLDATAALLVSINGQVTEEEARALILNKLHNIVSQELERYLNAEKRALIAGVEKLWDKYAVSSQQLETDREATLGQLNGFLSGLGYLGGNKAQ